MEEIGLQFETRQEHVINAVRQYVSRGGMRLIEECPLRQGMKPLQPAAAPDEPSRTARPEAAHNPWRASHLAALFESYFDYYFTLERRHALIVGPTVGRWTAVLYGEKAIDCRLLRWVSGELTCRGVGYCFLENEEYSYAEFASGRVVEIYSSTLMDSGGQNFWSAGKGTPPPEGPLIATGFLKNRYHFIPGFYDLPFVHGRKSTFTCYRYSVLPDLYDAAGNYPLSAFRYFYFHCAPEEDAH